MVESTKYEFFLSVIIPVYNCAPVVERCLDSIDYPEAEIIVVDDGSTDNTARVVEEYQKRHNNVQLIRKKNGGPSSARNEGMLHANGKYICFIDADDYLSQGGLERVLRMAIDCNADIIKYKINKVSSDSPCEPSSVAENPIQIEMILGKAQALFHYDISDYHVVDALFRTETIKQNNLQFCTDLHLREDDVFMGGFYSVATKVIITDLPIYNYVMSSPYSSTHNQSIERNRVLIKSGLLAIRHRKELLSVHCPNQSFPYERLKYMRWVCSLRSAVEAEYSLDEYISLLEEFKNEGVYPLEYAWIRVAGWDYSCKSHMKFLLRTFLINNPRLGFPIAKWYYLRETHKH